ncbi:hypothetical protein VTK73DRAFT_5455 [Phialemonium thermophilum]|uniref:Secreted protein n=1 Tax=Phialemonium thermophilum TaxID=223376 RepID=A0ABR3V1P1_9PEZI
MNPFGTHRADVRTHRSFFFFLFVFFFVLWEQRDRFWGDTEQFLGIYSGDPSWGHADSLWGQTSSRQIRRSSSLHRALFRAVRLDALAKAPACCSVILGAVARSRQRKTRCLGWTRMRPLFHLPYKRGWLSNWQTSCPSAPSSVGQSCVAWRPAL